MNICKLTAIFSVVGFLFSTPSISADFSNPTSFGEDCPQVCAKDGSNPLGFGSHAGRPMYVCVAKPDGEDYKQSDFIGYNWKGMCRVAANGKDHKKNPFSCICVK